MIPRAPRAAPAAPDPAIRAACIRTLFQQIPNSFAAAAVVTVYMIATAAPFFSVKLLALWLAIQIATQLYRIWLLVLYRRIPSEDLTGLELAARRNSIYMLLAGLVWGWTAFFFIDPRQPLTVALTMCGLYGIAGGSVPGNAYNPAGLFLFIAAIFGLVMLRLSMIGEYGYLVLGVASLCYAGILALFCRVQHREMLEGFAIRFENRRLLAALEVEKGEAQAAGARAERASLAKSQLLVAASHDLRQPLHALSLFSGSLQSLALDDEAKAIAERIQSNVAAMEALFNGLLDISRLEAGVVHSRSEGVSVQALFDRLAGYFDPVAHDEGVDLGFRNTPLWVCADPTLLEQVFVNLLSNALRHARACRVLVAARRQAGGRVSIAVIDDGAGVPPADQARIFEDFVQLGNPERDRSKGLGLGLAIAQRFAGLMDSRIELRSAPGRGARFKLALPGAPVGAAALRPVDGPDLVAGLRLLIVDDDQEVRASAARLVRGWGATVECASDAAAAAALIGAHDRFDVCLCDHRLPGALDGLTLIARLASAARAPRAFCLVTGDMDPRLLAAADAARVPVVHKPVQPARLRALLNHLGRR